MESLFIQLSDDVYKCILMIGFVVQGHILSGKLKRYISCGNF